MKKLILTVILSLILPLSVLAERERYIDKEFNFSKVKTVLLASPKYTDQVSDIKERELTDTFFTTLAKMKNFKVVTPKEVIAALEAKENISFKEFAKQDEQKAHSMFLEEAKNHADMVVFTNVFTYTTGMQRVEATQTQVPTTTTSRIYTPNGVVRVYTRGTTTHTIPAHYELALYVGVRFDAVSVNDYETPVISIIDNRGKLATSLGRKTPDKMYLRVLKSFLDEMNGLPVKKA